MSRLALPEGRWATDREWLTSCPECKREKFYWNTTIKKGICHRCKITVHGDKQFQRMFELSTSSTLPKATINYEVLPSDAIPATFSKEATEYLYGRYLSDIDILQSGFYYSSNHIYCPIDPLSVEYPKSWMRRAIKGKGRWFALKGTEKKNYVYGWSKMCNELDKYEGAAERVLCLCEGVFDAIPRRLGVPTVAILGSHISRVLLHAIESLNPRCIYTGFDPDAAGKGVTTRCRRLLERGLGICVHDLGLPYELGDVGPLHPCIRRAKAEIAMNILTAIGEEEGLYD